MISKIKLAFRHIFESFIINISSKKSVQIKLYRVLLLIMLRIALWIGNLQLIAQKVEHDGYTDPYPRGIVCIYFTALTARLGRYVRVNEREFWCLEMQRAESNTRYYSFPFDTTWMVVLGWVTVKVRYVHDTRKGQKNTADDRNIRFRLRGECEFPLTGETFR